MKIARDRYLNQIISHKHNGLIKIISGIRRSGKSYLLSELFQKHLLGSGVKKDHIIHLALDDYAKREYRNPDNCYQYVKASIKDEKMHYLLLDEVQMMGNFEDVLNGFLHIKNLDVYVTGSNSKFLSTDVVTEFRGRGDEIRVFPLSFKEFFDAFGDHFEDAWRQYYTFGGMPLAVLQNTDDEKVKYLKDLFLETYFKDIEERNNIKNNQELSELTDIIASCVGCLINPQKLSDTFQTLKHSDISAPTIKTYLNYLEDSFILDKVLRYDIKGKKYINTPSKYYFTDVGLRNARLHFRQLEESHLMENVIYNELKIRGFEVDIGELDIYEKTNESYKPKKIEVDFIANKGNKKYYIQSALSMPTEEKQIQEKRPLLKINDSFKKIIVTKNDIMPYFDDNGILTLGLKDFLLQDEL
ncbi:MAG: ATP-binding protein [Alphaproteobacteria bacterium]|nr:ATP-binding protein [Alphaproteobacteria bacterium]